MSKLKVLYLLMLVVVLVCSSSSVWGQTSGSDVYYATNYSGADASVKINACIAAVISGGGGICDAGGLGGTQTMSQEIRLGNSTSVATRVGVTLILPETATWFWHLTDGSSCGIRQYSSTSLLGHQPGGGGNRMVLAASSGSQMDAIYCIDDSATGANYVRAEGFAVWNNQPGSTFANGVVHIRAVVDQSRFVGIFAENYYGDVWHIDSACCGATFEEIQGTSNGTVSLSNGSNGGVPLTLGPRKVDGVSFHNCGFNAPGIGYPDIEMIGESAVNGVSFYNTYMEGNGTVDNTTPMIYVGPYVGSVHFFGGLANTEQTSLSGTKAVFENHGFYLDVPAFEAVNTTLGINDVMAKATVAVWDFSGNLGVIPPYQTPHALTTAASRSR